MGVEYRPIRALNIRAYYSHAEKGPDHTELGTMPREEIPPLDPIVWKSTSTGLLVTYQIVNDLYARLGYEWRNVSGEYEYIAEWTAEVYHGKTVTLQLGLNFGF